MVNATIPSIGKIFRLTSWRRILFVNLIVSHLVKTFPVLNGTRRFITACTSARHLSLSWARSIQSIPSHLNSWRSILILSSWLRLCLPSRLFPSGCPTKTPYRPLLPIRATCPAHLIILDVITRTILGEQYRPLSSSLCRFFIPLYLVSLRSKFSPKHPILKQPQPTFLPQLEWPRFTTKQNNRQNYIAAYHSL